MKAHMKINGVIIEDTFAEAFPMKATRILITASSHYWAYCAANTMTGFATSVIACGCEADLERELKPSETPDGRPGVSVLLFSMSGKELGKQIQKRVGQCVLTCPTTACFSGLKGDESLPMGNNLRFFGDGFQISKRINGRRYWRVPVMDGEFLCEGKTGVSKAIGGGNFLILADTQANGIAAAEEAVKAIRKLPNVIMPFPGGVVRSGSKVGSKYKGLPASTNDAYCPTIKGQVKSALGPKVGAVLEIVIDGLDNESIRKAMHVGIQAACSLGAEQGISRISAGHYGGNLGPYHFKLWEILK